jgi:hypothetical protein
VKKTRPEPPPLLSQRFFTSYAKAALALRREQDKSTADRYDLYLIWDTALVKYCLYKTVKQSYRKKMSQKYYMVRHKHIRVADYGKPPVYKSFLEILYDQGKEQT